MLSRLAPHPHRGDTVAAGVVVLTLFAVLTTLRFAADWSSLARVVLSGAIAALVAAMAAQADAGDDVPRAYEAILYVCSFLLIGLLLGNLADLLGSDGGAGTAVWVGLLLVGYCLAYARGRNSAVMTLLAALAGVVVVNAFVDWVFDPQKATTFEWVLLLCAVALTLLAVAQRDARRRHAVALVDVVGLTILALGLIVFATTVVTSLFGGLFGGSGAFGFHGGPAGWELVLLAFGFGLIAYGAVDRERVPQGLGIAVLGMFLAHAAWPGRDGPSLIGWPIVLLLIAGGLLAIGLRPRRELPPEPPVESR